MKELRPMDTRSPFVFKPHHWKLLAGSFIICGLLWGFLLLRLIYDVSTDPYSYPFGNTRENSWVYASQRVYVCVALFCLLSNVTGTGLIIAGQLKERRKFAVVGIGLVALSVAVLLGTGMVE
jgi:hypothetical protein